jgi:Subunit 17 of Mediator complex
LIFTRDPRFADKKEKTLRIRVQAQQGTTSSFAGPRDCTKNGLSEIEIELYKARDSLFDEELYHEVRKIFSSTDMQLTKEARVTLNSGVVITETEIQVPLPNGSTISISQFLLTKRWTQKR